MPEELGERLSAARGQRRLSQDEVAAVLGVSRVLVSHWEHGQRRPSEQTLERLASIYGLSLVELLNAQIAEPTPDLAELLYRDAGDNIDLTARAGLEDFVRFLDVYADFIDKLGEDYVPLRQSPFWLRKGFMSKDDTRRKAEEVRGWLRLGFAPVGDLTAMLDEAGITVYRTPLGSDLDRSVSGAFLNHRRLGMCIAVNVETTPGRQTFTIAHELAHALYHSSSVSHFVSRWGRKDERERFADMWAGEFLVPMEGLRRATESLGIKSVTQPEEVVHLQRYYGVSYGMMLLRLSQGGLLDASAFDRLKNTQPLVVATRLGYQVLSQEWHQDPNRWRLERFPKRFVRLLTRAIHSDRISIPSAASLTGLTIDDISELVSPITGDSDPGLQEELEELRDARERTAV